MTQIYTTSRNTNIATVIKNLQHCEEVQAAFSLLRCTAKGEVVGSISMLKIPDPIQNNSALYPEISSSLQFQPPWREIDDMDEIMTKLISQNKLHLHQVWETPFAQGPLKDYIDDYGLGKGVTEIIEGNFDPNKSKNILAVNYWLKHNIQRVVPPSSVSTELSVEMFKAAVKKQSEMTTLSPSGHHYSHYKAILIDDSICFVHATMMTLPL
eukprot:9089580-Ditylum_brightwellii.AAC.2